MYTCVILLSIDALAINNPGSVIFCGQSNGVLVMRRAWDLEPLHSIDFSSHGGIRCLRLITGLMLIGISVFIYVTDDQFLLVGFSDGMFAVCTDPEARYRMLHTAMLKNPLMGSVV